MVKRQLSTEDYSALAEFRYLIRRFLEFSENEAKRVGMTPRQHQALLAIKGYGRGRPLTVGELAERLRIRHHSAVELSHRLADAGLVTRASDPEDQRRVLLALTEEAEADLAELSAAHVDELSRIEPLFTRALERRRGSKN